MAPMEPAALIGLFTRSSSACRAKAPRAALLIKLRSTFYPYWLRLNSHKRHRKLDWLEYRLETLESATHFVRRKIQAEPWKERQEKRRRKKGANRRGEEDRGYVRNGKLCEQGRKDTECLTLIACGDRRESVPCGRRTVCRIAWTAEGPADRYG